MSIYRLLIKLGAAVGLSLAAHASSLYQSDIEFVDDHGQRVHLSDFKGHAAIVTMEYADCRFICSTVLFKLKEVQTLADRAGSPFDIIVISVDPAHDTPEIWTHYRQERGLSRTNWHFLTASDADTKRMSQRLGIHYWLMDSHILHDYKLLRTDVSGSVASVVDRFDADLRPFLAQD